MKERRVVDMRAVLRQDQQDELGGRMIPDPYSCDCPTCSCPAEEVFRPYPYYVEDDWLRKMREHLDDQRIILLIQKAFDDGDRGSSGDIVPVVDLSWSLNLLENQPTKLMEFVSKLGEEHGNDRD